MHAPGSCHEHVCSWERDPANVSTGLFTLHLILPTLPVLSQINTEINGPKQLQLVRESVREAHM